MNSDCCSSPCSTDRLLNGIASPLSERAFPKALSMCGACVSVCACACKCMRVYVRVPKGGLKACVCLHVSVCICVCECMVCICVSHARTYNNGGLKVE